MTFWMASTGKVFFVGLLLATLLLGCAGGPYDSIGQAPQSHAAVQDLPVDLDLVVRFDVRRIRDVLPKPIFELLLGLGLEYHGMGLFQSELEQTEVLWIGFRSLPEGSRRGSTFEGDYVWVLEGTFQSNAQSSWRDLFFPPRDLGAAYLRYDAKQIKSRFAPGRVYEKARERLVIASAAEVDAVEKVIERHYFTRTVVPQERGAISFAASTQRLAQTLTESSPKAAGVLERALGATGYVDITQQAVQFHARMAFDRREDAARGQEALRIVLALLLLLENTEDAVEKAGFYLRVVERDLVIRFEYQLPDIMAWLGFS